MSKPDELNPHHPVTQKASDHWHKIVALIMNKLNLKEVTITEAEIMKSMDADLTVLLHDQGNQMTVKLMKTADAIAYAQERGGNIES